MEERQGVGLARCSDSPCDVAGGLEAGAEADDVIRQAV